MYLTKDLYQNIHLHLKNKENNLIKEWAQHLKKTHSNRMYKDDQHEHEKLVNNISHQVNAN